MATAQLEEAACLELVEPKARALLAQRMKTWPAFRGDRRLEQVKAPVIKVEERQVWVNGKPLTGTAILDTGAMPLLIGKAGMQQLGWGPEDIIPEAVTLGLADGKSSKPFPLTKKPVQFVFNKGKSTETSIAVRAVVTQAPYDFLIGNVVMWSMGMVVDSWRELVQYRVDWREGRDRAGDSEGYLTLDYERDTGSGALPPAFMADGSGMILPPGGADADSSQERGGSDLFPEPEDLPDLEDGSESDEDGETPALTVVEISDGESSTEGPSPGGTEDGVGAEEGEDESAAEGSFAAGSDTGSGAGERAAGAVMAYADDVYEVSQAGWEEVKLGPDEAFTRGVERNVDVLGRRQLPPEWRYRGASRRVYHAEAQSFDGEFYRGRTEWNVQRAADGHMEWVLGREWPQWLDALGMIMQRADQPPPPPPEQDETVALAQPQRCWTREPQTGGGFCAAA